MKKIFPFIIIVSFFSISFAQNNDFHTQDMYDFWLGNWDVSWDEGNGKKGKGENIIEKKLDGKVIIENFSIHEGQSKGFKGTSMSVYNAQSKIWKQTWGDNQGGHFNFIGNVEGDFKIFQTQPLKQNGKEIVYRMVFKDITKNSLIWNWESSIDGGEKWKLNWRIFYQRKNPSKSNKNNTSKFGKSNPKAPSQIKEYGQLVGEWDCNFSALGDSGNVISESKANWIFTYVLDGYAIQDYWKVPKTINNPQLKQMLGTNLRTFNPKLNLWQCIWLENQTNSLNEIWLSRKLDDGSIIIYDEKNTFEIMFYNITDTTFDWKWDIKQKDGTMKTKFRIKANKA